MIENQQKLTCIRLIFVEFLSKNFRSPSATAPKGDIKDDFCGKYINYQYCKCAFHNDFCDAIGMSKSEAKKYVNGEYDKWVEEEKEKFGEDCVMDGGIYKSGVCEYCEIDEAVSDGKCVEIDLDEEDEDEDEDEKKGECRYDNECPNICEGDIRWKQGCNARTDSCEKTFDDNCGEEKESFGELSFNKTCKAGECVRDEDGINNKKNELEEEKKKLSDELKKLNAEREEVKAVMMDANKDCINGIADMTNLAIVEFASRVASIMAGGMPDLASASVDYAGDGLNKLYAYTDGTPPEEQKLKPHEYIKLHCDLYDYFKNILSASDAEMDRILKEANIADEQLKKLP